MSILLNAHQKLNEILFVCFPLFMIPLQTQRKVDVATLKDEMVKLKSQIVESPEELKNEMERMKENVKSIRMSKVCIISMLFSSCETFAYKQIVFSLIRSTDLCSRVHVVMQNL